MGHDHFFKYSDVEGIQALNNWQSFWMHVLNTIYQKKQGQWMTIMIVHWNQAIQENRHKMTHRAAVASANMYKWDQLPVPIWMLSASQWALCRCGLNMEL